MADSNGSTGSLLVSEEEDVLLLTKVDPKWVGKSECRRLRLMVFVLNDDQVDK